MKPKFRAWSSKTAVLAEVINIDFREKKLKVSHWEYGDSIYFPLGEVELMQSTGLKDKNGVEIFEGDIVHRRVHLVLFGSDLNKWIDEYACVEWKYGGWHVGEDLLDLILDEGVDRHTLCRQTAIEIAGNIYENPELLEVEG